MSEHKEEKKVYCNFATPDSTGSRGQDALKAGFLITCNEGLAILLRVKDITVEACKEFYPRAVAEAKEKLEKFVKGRKDWKPSPPSGIFGGIFERTIRLFKPIKHPEWGELYLGETVLDTNTGRYGTSIREKFPDGHTEYVTESTCRAKLGSVAVENYDNYTKLLVPDHVIEDIKIATEIGMHDIKIAYAKLSDAVQKDPLVIGYVGDQMFLISRFNPGEKAYPTLNMPKTANTFGAVFNK